MTTTTLLEWTNESFAPPVPETNHLDLDEAIAVLGRQRLTDTVVEASSIRLPEPGLIALGDGDAHPITRSAFVQLLHFVNIQWRDAADGDPAEVLATAETRFKDRPGQMLLRAKKKTVQAVLGPGYTPVTNFDVLKAAKESLDASQVRVTVFRGGMRMTGVTDRVTFQPAVGDILSGGWEVTNDEFGKGVLSVNQFLLRLVCTNGAVVPSSEDKQKFVHRGWGREELVAHLSEVGAATVARMGVLDERLREMPETKLGEETHEKLARLAAPSLGKEGVKEFRTAVAPDASVYDAYNHLTFVSQQKRLAPRRQLELIAGGLLATS